MAIEAVIWKGTEILLTAAGSAGAKVLVEEAVKKLTPENLSTVKKYCVEVAQWGGTTAVAAVVASGIHKNVEKAENAYKKVNAIFEKVDVKIVDAEPVIDTDEDNSPVEIEEETEEIPVVDLD